MSSILEYSHDTICSMSVTDRTARKVRPEQSLCNSGLGVAVDDGLFVQDSRMELLELP